jgi:hypothetical protein
MVHRVAKVVGAATGALVLAGAGLAVLGHGADGSSNPAAEALADRPSVTDFSIHADGSCRFDPERGGMVLRDLTISSRSTGVLAVSVYVQRDSLDDILPGYVSTVVAFDEDSREHTFDLVVPVTKDQYEAGYDECFWSTGRV